MNSIPTATKRDFLEAALIEKFGPKLMSLASPEAPGIINAHKDGTFGRSYLAYQLYTNGHNAFSRSTNYPHGMLFNDGENIFGVGVFPHPETPDLPCVHVVAPHGKNYVDAVKNFIKDVEEAIPGSVVYVRQLSPEQTRELATLDLDLILKLDTDEKKEEFARGGSSLKMIHYGPWHQKAWQEDETYHSSDVDLDAVIREPENGMFNNITTAGLSRNARNKSRNSYNAAAGFMEDFGLEYQLRPYNAQEREGVTKLVKSHFDRLYETGKGLGSTAADYQAIIDTLPEKTPSTELKMYVGYIGRKGVPDSFRPVSFYALENLDGKEVVAAYANIVHRDVSVLEGLVPKEKIDAYRAFKAAKNAVFEAADAADALQAPKQGDDISELQRKAGVAAEAAEKALVAAEALGVNRTLKESPLPGYDNFTTYANGWMMHTAKQEGAKKFIYGGSEEPDLDHGKQRVGATPRVTHWLLSVPNKKWLDYLRDDNPRGNDPNNSSGPGSGITM